ncbi:hypothetical protein MRX96_002685 [Rhipicephalus microplus]
MSSPEAYCAPRARSSTAAVEWCALKLAQRQAGSAIDRSRRRKKKNGKLSPAIHPESGRKLAVCCKEAKRRAEVT